MDAFALIACFEISRARCFLLKGKNSALQLLPKVGIICSFLPVSKQVQILAPLNQLRQPMSFYRGQDARLWLFGGVWVRIL
jgi:hypothetical protein